MGQLDPSSARRPADPSSAEPIFHSLEDRLLFRQAQALLAGLTDCGHVNAARSLRITASELDVDVAALARRFLGGLTEPRAEPARTLLLRIALLALLPDGAAGGRGVVAQDVPPANELGVAGRAAEAPGAVSLTPVSGGLSVQGVLDAAAVPLLGARTPPPSVAHAIESNGGEVFELDLAGLTDLDGAGVRALEALAARVSEGGATLRVTTPRSPGLCRFLDLAVSLRWLPVAFEVKSSASMRAHGGRTDPRPARWMPAPSDSERLAELEALYDCYASASWSLARRLLGDDGEADAVVQTAFLDAWRQSASSTPPAGRAGAQLLHRTHREAVHRLREGRAGPRPPIRVVHADEPPARPDRHHALWLLPSSPRARLSSLPEQQARALQLAFWNGLTVQEIAATTGSALADVRADLLAGVRTLSSARDHPRSADLRGHGADRTEDRGRPPHGTD